MARKVIENRVGETPCLPALNVIFPRAEIRRIVSPRPVLSEILGSLVRCLRICVSSWSSTGSLVRSLGTGVFLKVFHIMGRVSALESIGGCALLLAFPKKMSAKRFCQFGRKHIAAGSSWRVGDRLRSRRLHSNRLGSRNVRTTHGEVFLVVLGRRCRDRRTIR